MLLNVVGITRGVVEASVVEAAVALVAEEEMGSAVDLHEVMASMMDNEVLEEEEEGHFSVDDFSVKTMVLCTLLIKMNKIKSRQIILTTAPVAMNVVVVVVVEDQDATFNDILGANHVVHVEKMMMVT